MNYMNEFEVHEVSIKGEEEYNIPKMETTLKSSLKTDKVGTPARLKRVNFKTTVEECSPPTKDF